MKVLLVSHRPNYIGGIASWTKRMLKVKHENICFTLVDSSPINRDAFKNTKHSIKDEAIRSINIWRNEAKVLRADKEIEIVHTNIPCTLMGQLRETITGIICKVYKRKFVLHCHSTVPNVVKSKISRIYFGIFLKICDGIIVLNNPSKKFVEACGGKNVQVIPNFVLEEDLNLKSEKEISDKIHDALYVGGVTPDKGCDLIIEAAKSLPNITFHLLGLVSKQIEEMERTDNVKLYGNVDAKSVKRFMKDSDIFLFLSRFYGEGFSCALTEAMAQGLPCIVSDWAANKDMIEDKGGIVLKESTSGNLINAIEKINNEPNVRKKMADWNIRKVDDSYTDKAMKRLYSDFYNKVVQC